MLLKVLNGCGGWAMFGDFDRITYRGLPPDEIIGVRDDVVDMTFAQERPESEPRKEIWLYGSGGQIRQIVASAPAYIMNDRGETIERI